jgi:hypothetical protein
MKRFLATFMGSANNARMDEWNQLSPEQKKERERAGMDAWGKWVEQNKKHIVDHGAPIGKTKLASASGVSETKNMITAYTVVEAESHDAAAKMFLNHPHFSIFPGVAVEIMECLPMPGPK